MSVLAIGGRLLTGGIPKSIVHYSTSFSVMSAFCTVLSQVRYKLSPGKFIMELATGQVIIELAPGKFIIELAPGKFNIELAPGKFMY